MMCICACCTRVVCGARRLGTRLSDERRKTLESERQQWRGQYYNDRAAWSSKLADARYRCVLSCKLADSRYRCVLS